MLIYQEEPFTEGFPCANIHKLLLPDILYQLIKGALKDHLVMWIEKWVITNHLECKANEILDNIDWQYVYWSSENTMLIITIELHMSPHLLDYASFLRAKGGSFLDLYHHHRV